MPAWLYEAATNYSFIGDPARFDEGSAALLAVKIRKYMPRHR
jgi:hypothetical protein